MFNHQYLILINTQIFFQETAIIWKLVIPFTLFLDLMCSYFDTFLGPYLLKFIRCCSYHFMQCSLDFYPWIYLCLFPFYFQTSQTFLSGIICFYEYIFRICFKGSRGLHKFCFFLCFKCLILFHAWGIFYFVIILLQILIFSTLRMS